MTALLVAVLVAGAVGGPTWLDLAGSRRARRRVAASGWRRRPDGLGRPVGPARGRASGWRSGARVPAPALDAVRRLGAGPRRLFGCPVDPGAEVSVGVAMVLAGVVSVVLGPLVAVVVAVLVVLAPAVRSRGRRRRAERVVRGVLPDVVDLFRLAAGSGLSVHQAVAAVADRAPEPVGACLRSAVRRAAMGERLGDALDALEVLGDPARPLQSALTASARYGSPLGSTLERVGEDARMLRRREAEERARRLPVQLLFPLVVCVLPAFGLLAVVPLLAGSLPAISQVS